MYCTVGFVCQVFLVRFLVSDLSKIEHKLVVIERDQHSIFRFNNLFRAGRGHFQAHLINH